VGPGGISDLGRLVVAAGAVVVVVLVGGTARTGLGWSGTRDQHPGHRTVTGQPPARLRVQRSRPATITTDGTRTAEEAVQVDGDQQLGPHSTGLGESPALQVAAGQLGQGIGPALAAVAGVLSAGGAGQGFQGGQQRLAGLRLEESLEGDHAFEGRGQPEPATAVALLGPVLLAVRVSDQL
jgi:hypothetical protein